MTCRDLSIIIVNWNTQDLLANCLASINKTLGSVSNLDFETLVVDNASVDSSVEMVRSLFPWVNVIQNSANRGFAGANNQAIRISTGRYVLLLNSDTLLHDQAVSQMISFADGNQEIGAIGPRLIDIQGKTQLSWASFPTFWSEVLGKHYRSRKSYGNDSAYIVDWLAGACLMVRREVLTDVGLMDERFFLYSEETDWCKRISESGWLIVYYPAAVVSHFEGSSASQDVSRSRLLLHRSKVLYAYKHFGRLRGHLLKCILIFSGPIRAFRAMIHGRTRSAITHLIVAGRLLLSHESLE